MSRFDRDRSLTNVCTDTPGLASLRIEFLIEQSPSNSIVSYILFFFFLLFSQRLWNIRLYIIVIPLKVFGER